VEDVTDIRLDISDLGPEVDPLWTSRETLRRELAMFLRQELAEQLLDYAIDVVRQNGGGARQLRAVCADAIRGYVRRFAEG